MKDKQKYCLDATTMFECHNCEVLCCHRRWLPDPFKFIPGENLWECTNCGAVATVMDLIGWHPH